MPELPELIVVDAEEWTSWLAEHHGDAPGVRLVLAKKGVEQPTRLTRDEAVEAALCHGWIDGQLQRRDASTFRVRFTPRRPRSAWSQRNVALAERLVAEGRVHPAGLSEIERARADGRWQSAYAGSATIEVPDDLRAELARNAEAEQMFASLNAQNRYAVLYRISTARRPETRRSRIERFVAMLGRGETPYPQTSAPRRPR
jgi:uncharacterized protein YdeI (YjbR/CyaY-like superfamily)